MAKTDANYDTHHKTNVLMMYIVHIPAFHSRLFLSLFFVFMNTPHIIKVASETYYTLFAYTAHSLSVRTHM